jgi:hypothetical protein|tara:strand:+ start:3726 stop:3905 length:180 start_codon:yes stop_codon:yes gene_type:complete
MTNLPAVQTFYAARKDDNQFVVTAYAFVVGMLLPIIIPCVIGYLVGIAIVGMFTKKKGA